MPTILIVEDNEMNVDMLTQRLKRKGFDIITAADGKSGIAKAQDALPDLILMDLSLPVIDGWEATRQIKASATSCHIPIIALTAHAMDEDKDQALIAGCDDYDSKPVDLPRLLEKINRLLTSKSEHETTRAQ